MGWIHKVAESTYNLEQKSEGKANFSHAHGIRFPRRGYLAPAPFGWTHRITKDVRKHIHIFEWISYITDYYMFIAMESKGEG